MLAMLAVISGDHLRGQDLLLHGVPLGVQPHMIDLAVDIDEQRIARGMGDQQMELAVPLGEGVLVVDRVLAMRQHRLHVVEMTPGGMQHGEPRGEGLDREPRLDQLQRAHLIGEIARASRRGGGGADKGAAAEAPRDQTRFFQLIEGAADRAARRLKGRGQLALGRQPVAFAIGAGLDGPLEIG